MSEPRSQRQSTALAHRHPELEAIAVESGIAAAHAVRSNPSAPSTMRLKSTPTDPVTDLDLEAERVIRAVLAERTPDASILGEEDGDQEGRSSVGWIVDPIDGTVNLTYDLPIMAVSVAATVEGTVVAGAVIDIWRDEVFSAAAGSGARKDGTLIRPSSVERLSSALVGTGFDYAAPERAIEAGYLARVLPAARDIRCFGSAALNLCWVACGRLDAFYQRKMQRWDYAAGLLIASEAGARVAPPTRENGQLTVVASAMIFDELDALVSGQAQAVSG